MEHKLRYEAVFEDKFRDALAYFKKNNNRPRSKLRGIPEGIRVLQSDDNVGVISSASSRCERDSAPGWHSSPRQAAGYSARDNKAAFDRLGSQIDKVLRAPELGKPLRYEFKNRRRIHVGSFVLLYEIREAQKEILFLNFDHHDKIYKKK